MFGAYRFGQAYFGKAYDDYPDPDIIIVITDALLFTASARTLEVLAPYRAYSQESMFRRVIIIAPWRAKS